MSDLKFKNFNLKTIQEGNFDEIKSTFAEVKEGKIARNNLLYAIDALANNEKWLSDFSEAFSKELKVKIDFKKLSPEMLEKQEQLKAYDVTQGSITPTIGTDILPTIEALIRNTALLNEIQIKNVQKNSFIQMYDFDSEQNAVILAEIAAGTDVDEVLRTGDNLIPNQKIQASMKMSEFTLETLDAGAIAVYLVRLIRRVKGQLITAILYNGNAVGNGTPRASNFRGIKNNYGVNAVGDLSGTIGAIAYASKATADAAIVAAGGAGSVDAHDLCVKVKELLLPSNLVDAEEDGYVFVMNRRTWGAVSTVLDANGRYKVQSAIDPVTGKAVKLLDGARVVIQPQVVNSEVFLIQPAFITLIVNGDFLNLNDDGKVQLKEGLVQFVSRIWANGSLEYGQKFRPTTNVVVGTTVPDNADQNAFRVFLIV